LREAGSKLAKAEALGIETWDEARFLERVPDMTSDDPSLAGGREPRGTLPDLALPRPRRSHHRIAASRGPVSKLCCRFLRQANPESNTMSNLVVIAFDDEQTAFQMRSALVGLQRQYLIEMEDVVVVSKDDKGEVKLHQAINLTAAGAAGGGFWGLLIGTLFLNPLLGVAVGAGAGALSGKLSDIGINDDFMKGLAESFKPGCSAVFVLVRKATPDKVVEGLAEFRGKGKLLQTSLSRDEEDSLRAAIEG